MESCMLQAERIEIDDDLWGANAFFEEKGWSDGLPIVPPTEERVVRMLEAVRHDPQDVVGFVPPRWAPATVEKIAINAVMAGCRPEYMPVLVAAVEAITDPRLNLYALQATTGGPAIMLIVNGPIRRKLQINGGPNALGEGWRANATIGRTIRLIQRNIGGSYPGTTCKATLGWPGKYGMCIGENEEASPWEPLHVERGFRPEESTVTAISADGLVRASDLDSTTAEGVLTIFSQRMSGPAGPEAIMVVCPEHAKIIAGDGYSKKEVKRFLWERAIYSLKDLPEESFAQRVKRRPDLKLTRDSVLKIVDRPEDILVVVAGGDGSQSQYIHVWGQSTPEGGSTRSVTKVVSAS
ncbi:MAG TPA: hypothetical protein VNN77_20090 [candidate division Zixibacteria bacterium]|nr:hypothetical protein [candidate division Zixibacteria bacterium]